LGSKIDFLPIGDKKFNTGMWTTCLTLGSDEQAGRQTNRQTDRSPISTSRVRMLARDLRKKD